MAQILLQYGRSRGLVCFDIVAATDNRFVGGMLQTVSRCHCNREHLIDPESCIRGRRQPQDSGNADNDKKWNPELRAALRHTDRLRSLKSQVKVEFRLEYTVLLQGIVTTSMAVAIVTGSAGLIGSYAVRFFAHQGFDVVGIDNDMRKYFFGSAASTQRNRRDLIQSVVGYAHIESDIRDTAAVEATFSQYSANIMVVIHAAAQPSHDWAASEPLTDFSVNANGTLNLLEAARKFCPDAVFIFVSTNKVYGDTPNRLPLVELEKRWDIAKDHAFHAHGIDESMSIDQTLHSLFGASKLAADVLVQEYGRYFGMSTACFRAGCLTGPGHAAAELHGFLAYLVKCAVEKTPYTVLGYKGKQVRDNLHARDLVQAFWHFFNNPKSGEVYNIGGGRQANCSMLEAIEIVETVCGCSMNWSYKPTNRTGDHIWWVSDTRKFRAHYPDWKPTYGIDEIIAEIRDALEMQSDSSAQTSV